MLDKDQGYANVCVGGLARSWLVQTLSNESRLTNFLPFFMSAIMICLSVLTLGI